MWRRRESGKQRPPASRRGPTPSPDPRRESERESADARKAAESDRERHESGGKRPHPQGARAKWDAVRSKGTKASAGVGRWRKSADRGLIKTESGGHGRVPNV